MSKVPVREIAKKWGTYDIPLEVQEMLGSRLTLQELYDEDLLTRNMNLDLFYTAFPDEAKLMIKSFFPEEVRSYIDREIDDESVHSLLDYQRVYPEDVIYDSVQSLLDFTIDVIISQPDNIIFMTPEPEAFVVWDKIDDIYRLFLRTDYSEEGDEFPWHSQSYVRKWDEFFTALYNFGYNYYAVEDINYKSINPDKRAVIDTLVDLPRGVEGVGNEWNNLREKRFRLVEDLDSQVSFLTKGTTLEIISDNLVVFPFGQWDETTYIGADFYDYDDARLILTLLISPEFSDIIAVEEIPIDEIEFYSFTE